MRTPTPIDLAALLAPQRGPCVSIYIPTERAYPNTGQNHIRFKNAVDAAEASLAKSHPDQVSRPILERFRRLIDDRTFWQGQLDGLAVLGSVDQFYVYELGRQVPESASVGDTFHVKPLLRVVQSADRYQVMALSRDRVSFFQGNRDSLSEFHPEGVPATLEQALGEAVRVAGRSDVHGPDANHPDAGKSKPGHVTHGSPAKGADTNLDEHRFFLVIDRAVTEHVSNPSKLPLILAAMPDHQGEFRKLSHNHYLYKQGIEKNPYPVDVKELCKAAWQLFEPRYNERLKKFVDDYQIAFNRGQGSENLAQILDAAKEGRIGILLVDADRQASGRYDRDTGDVVLADLKTDPAAGDLLDEAAELAVKTDATVVVVPHDRMPPTASGAAAVFRY